VRGQETETKDLIEEWAERVVPVEWGLFQDVLLTDAVQSNDHCRCSQSELKTRALHIGRVLTNDSRN